MIRRLAPKILVAVAGAVALAAVLTFGCGRGGDVSRPSARAMVEKGALLVDVRTPEEYAEGHIPDAINVPVQELEARMAELPKDRPIVVYCRSGKRSARAASMLQAAGYTSIHDLGAMSSW